MTIIIYLLKKISILILVLIITLLVTIFLLGSTIDKIMVDNIRMQVTNSLSDSISENQRLNQLQDPQERQAIIDKQISIQIKSLGSRRALVFSKKNQQ